MRWLCIAWIAGCGMTGAGDAGGLGLDAGVDGGADAGLDCSRIGCARAPLCGEECTEPCGCCPCDEAETFDERGVRYTCVNGCFVEGLMLGEPCADDSDCGGGLSCCYPCGVPDCQNICDVTCSADDPACVDGCRPSA